MELLIATGEKFNDRNSSAAIHLQPLSIDLRDYFFVSIIKHLQYRDLRRFTDYRISNCRRTDGAFSLRGIVEKIHRFHNPFLHCRFFTHRV